MYARRGRERHVVSVLPLLSNQACPLRRNRLVDRDDAASVRFLQGVEPSQPPSGTGRVAPLQSFPPLPQLEDGEGADPQAVVRDSAQPRLHILVAALLDFSDDVRIEQVERLSALAGGHRHVSIRRGPAPAARTSLNVFSLGKSRSASIRFRLRRGYGRPRFG